MNSRSEPNFGDGSILQLGVVGFGKLGMVRAAIANVLPGCRQAALGDDSSKFLSVFQQFQPGVRCFSSHTEVLREVALDAVIIATHTHLHIPIASDVVAKGIPVFSEKPLTVVCAQTRPPYSEGPAHLVL